MKSAFQSRLTAVVAVAMAITTYSATAGPMPQPAAPDVRQLGPQIGERVPDFTLNDQQGRSHTLHSLLAPRGLMLVFFRSADW